MKTITLSRGPEVDTEQCIKNVGGNRFDMVILASHRAREMKRQHMYDGNTTNFNAPVSALLEIQEGPVDPKWKLKIK